MAKKKVKTGTIWYVRSFGYSGYLSTHKMSLREARQADNETSIFFGSGCRQILGLPLPKRLGASLRLTFTVDTPKSKPKKKPAKKAAKKRRT